MYCVECNKIMIFLYKYLGFFFLLSLLMRMLLVEAKQSFKILWSIRAIPVSQVKLQFVLCAEPAPSSTDAVCSLPDCTQDRAINSSF